MAFPALNTVYSLRDELKSIVQQSLAAVELPLPPDLVAEHQVRIARLARRLMNSESDVEDITQEVFVVFIEKSAHFRAQSSISTWLTSITLNICRSRLRRQSVLKQLLPKKLRLILRHQPHSPAADWSALQSETHQAIHLAIEQLPVRDREVIVLHFLEEMPIDEVASVLECTTNTASVRLHRAKQRLKSLLTSLPEFESRGG